MQASDGHQRPLSQQIGDHIWVPDQDVYSVKWRVNMHYSPSRSIGMLFQNKNKKNNGNGKIRHDEAK